MVQAKIRRQSLSLRIPLRASWLLAAVVRSTATLALAAYPAGADRPAYFILLEIEDGRVTSIHDFRYVPYIAAEADFEILAT